jgi:thioredoxin 1
MHPVEITDANFEEEVLKSDLPVLIDFWAVWCGPCKMIAPVIDELASEYEGKIKVGKVDVDNNQGISVKYGIRSIPTLLIFKDGKIEDQIIGVLPKVKIVEKLNAHVKQTVN